MQRWTVDWRVDWWTVDWRVGRRLVAEVDEEVVRLKLDGIFEHLCRVWGVGLGGWGLGVGV